MSKDDLKTLSIILTKEDKGLKEKEKKKNIETGEQKRYLKMRFSMFGESDGNYGLLKVMEWARRFVIVYQKT